jgi:cytidine deaminase
MKNIEYICVKSLPIYMKEKNITAKIIVYSYNELTEDDKKLIDLAKDATKRSYAPYSKFNVGAAILLDNGEIITGANQENAAFPSGTCAERTAAFYASAKFPGVPFKKLAIASFTRGEFQANPVAPCGACRQALLEYEHLAGKPIEVLLYGSNEIYVFRGGIKDLLPLCFAEF